MWTQNLCHTPYLQEIITFHAKRIPPLLAKWCTTFHAKRLPFYLSPCPGACDFLREPRSIS